MCVCVCVCTQMEDVQWYDKAELASAVDLFDSLDVGGTIEGTYGAVTVHTGAVYRVYVCVCAWTCFTLWREGVQ